MENNILEQENEMQALECLYYHPGEFEKLSDNTFILNLLPWPDDEQENNIASSLYVEYTKTYPEEAPIWRLEKTKNLNPSQIEEMENMISEIISQSSGSCLVYTIADQLQSWMKDNNTPQVSMHDEMMNRLSNTSNQLYEDDLDMPQQELELDEAFKGLQAKNLCDLEYRITEEQFLSWSEQFKQEMEKTGVWKKKNIDRCPTGREMFELDASLAIYDNFQFNEE